ncbi:branched-chain amino acid ABC transporter permease [Xanthobacter autotrophicus]|uniref:branched-chain amino acid ABC transporter permease n=1 Tax=Xanthobacter autotrophicus TaxID=280 RepID=UPI00372C3D27
MLSQQIVNGVMLGSVYALIGVGYTLVFGVLRMLNLAHAYIFMAAPFAAYFAVTSGLLPPALGFPVGIVVAAALGALLYFVSFRPIPQSHALGGFVTSLSFGVIIQVILVNHFGSLKLPFDAGLSLPDVRIGEVILSGAQAASLAVSVVLMAALFGLIRKSRFGRNVRAIAENENAAQLLGVSVQRAVVEVFLISSALAGLAGLMVATRFEVISAYMSDAYALKALAVIVIGGLGDLRGALIAGLLLGVCEVLFQAYAPSGWSEAFVWILLILVFLVRPDGLFGVSVKRREV